MGFSKNRVLERFPDFDYYFFIEDDVELLVGGVFPTHVELARATGIHHFSLFESGGLRRQTEENVVSGYRILHGLFGSADFNFFTRHGLGTVGGWHPLFAQYRRWGHTEHSYRFPRAGLAPAPFNVIEALADSFIWHSPPAVTQVDLLDRDEDQLVRPERDLIDQELRHVPVQTGCPHDFNGVRMDRPEKLAATLGGGRYPLVTGSERRRCWSDFHLSQAMRGSGVARRSASFVRAVAAWPGNPMIRHRVKGILGW